jgi:hypothetical protein
MVTAVLCLVHFAAFHQTIKLWWGYLRLQASGTELHVEAVSDLDGSLMDSFTITKASPAGSSITHGGGGSDDTVKGEYTSAAVY